MPTVQSKVGNKAPAQRGNRQEKSEPRLDETLMEPGDYEVTIESTFTIEIYLKPHKNRWQVVSGPGEEVRKESVTMRMWTYDEMVELRKRATAYDSGKRMHVVDHDALNRLKAQKLFVSWTFQERNKRIMMVKHQGVMVDESWKKFTRLQPSIIKYIFDKMNEVYEYNG
jgi:hypothetical protein